MNKGEWERSRLRWGYFLEIKQQQTEHWLFLSAGLGLEGQFWSVLAGDGLAHCVAPMPSVHIASHTWGFVDGWGVGSGKNWHRSCPKCHLWPIQVKPFIKHLHIYGETSFAFLFLNVAFVFCFVTLWACSRPFLSFWCMLTRLRTKMQCEIIIGWQVES